MKFIIIIIIIVFMSSAYSYCDNVSIDNGRTVVMCDTDVDGRNVYLSEGCTDCMARRAYTASRSLRHTDEDSYHISIAIDTCRILSGEIVIGKESEEGRLIYLCHYPKDGSYIYAPHLVP